MKPYEYFIMILLVIYLILMSIDTILIILSIKEIRKFNKKESKNNEVDQEYLNSLEFNTRLDSIIRSLLGKHSNEDIVEIAIKTLEKSKDKASSFNKDALSKYIQDVLLNYTNSYEFVAKLDLEDNESDSKTEEEYYVPAREFSSNLNNTVDLTSNLQNFYK